MSDEILTPEEGTENGEVTPQAGQENETPQTPVETPEGKPEGTEPEQPTQQEQPDWKKKATTQGQENILLNARLEAERTRNAQLTSKDAPTDDEMRGLYSNWDELDEASKTFYRNQRQIDKRAARAEGLVLTLSERIEFDNKLDDFHEEVPADFKKLEGRETEFKRFAKRKANVGLPLNILAQAFLFDAQIDAPPAPHTPTNKGPGLENGSGGPRSAPTHKKISIEEAAIIRKTDWKRYKELSDTNQIEEFDG